MTKLMKKINNFMDDLYEHQGSRSWKGLFVKEDSSDSELLPDTPGQDDVGDVTPPAVSMKSWNTYKDINRKKNKTSTTGVDSKTGYEDPLKGYPYNEEKK